MVRSHVVTIGRACGGEGFCDTQRKFLRPRLARGVWVCLFALGQAAVSFGQTRTPATLDPAVLEKLLSRAATTAPGTYIVLAGSLVPAAEAMPLVVQADAYRGGIDQAIQVAVALGGPAPRATEARLRILSAQSTGTPPRVVADATASAQEGRMRLVREFALAAGEYDIHAVAGHPGTGEGPVAVLVKHRVTRPGRVEGTAGRHSHRAG